MNAYHHRSSDGKTEVVYVYDDESVFRHTFEDAGGKEKLRFDVAKATPGDEPDDSSVTRDKIDLVLVRDVTQGCLVETRQGCKMVVVGYDPVEERNLSFDELVKLTINRKKFFWYIDRETAVKAKDLDELRRLVPGGVLSNSTIKLEAVEAFFLNVVGLAEKRSRGQK